MKSHAELIIVPPEGHKADAMPEFLGRCIIHGVDFHFEEGDRLPRRVPEGIEGVRAIVRGESAADADASVAEVYAQRGARMYVLEELPEAVVPALPSPWNSEVMFHRIVFDAALTLDSPAFRKKMCARSDEFLHRQLGERLLQTNDLRWYDATRYNWEGLLDYYEVTGDSRYHDIVERQVHEAIETQENDLTNCDRVASLIPLLRLYEKTKEQSLLSYAREKFDRYLEVTPRYRGCLANFCRQPNNARVEILFQVCPGLLLLSRSTGVNRYAQIALDQIQTLHQLLYSEPDSLWHHGVNDRGPTGAFWARGVAFSLLAILQNLELTEPDSLQHPWLKANFQKTAARLHELQGPDGFWSQVVDDPRTEKESSGTAWAGAAIERGIRLGFLDPSFRPCADAAWQAVKSRVFQGFFPGHSTATTATPSHAYYVKKQLSPTGWTHFAVRLACERRRTQLGQG